MKQTADAARQEEIGGQRQGIPACDARGVRTSSRSPHCRGGGPACASRRGGDRRAGLGPLARGNPARPAGPAGRKPLHAGRRRGRRSRRGRHGDGRSPQSERRLPRTGTQSPRIVETQRAHCDVAVATAEEALDAARHSRQPKLEATSLLRLAEAQFSDIATTSGKPVKRPRRPCACSGNLEIRPAKGAPGRALAPRATAKAAPPTPTRAAHKALALAERSGDLYRRGRRVEPVGGQRAGPRRCAFDCCRTRAPPSTVRGATQRGQASRREQPRRSPICNSGCIGAPGACSGWPSTSIGKAACHRARPRPGSWQNTERRMGNLPEARRYAEASCALWVQPATMR